MQIFYVYEHWRPDTGLPFYVGKGMGERIDSLANRNKHYLHIVSKLQRLGLQLEARKVFTGLDEEMAFTLERSQISYWKSRGVKLANQTNGGDGSSGYKWTDEQRRRASAYLLTPEIRALNSARVKKAFARPEVKAKHRAAVKASASSIEVKKRMSAGWSRWRERQQTSPRILPVWSEERKEKHRARCQASMAHPDVRERHQKALEAAWGHNHSARALAMSKPEAREKISRAVTAWWARRKEGLNVASN